jgi:lysophospholipase L1-like esterase
VTELSYLALGDSYTIGEGVTADARWTHQLSAALRGEGIALHDPRTIARTGWTTDELSAALDAFDVAVVGAASAASPCFSAVPNELAAEAAPTKLRPYDLVSLAIGVNNQYRGRDASNYREEFEALLLRAIGFAGGRAERVVVLSIPDWGATRFGAGSGRDLARVSAELDAYNAAARAICDRLGAAFVDITPLSREHGDDGAMLAADGLHPGPAMYARWAQLAQPAVRAALKGRA